MTPTGPAVTAVITDAINLTVRGTGFTRGERLTISLADNPEGDNATALNEGAPYVVPRNGRLNYRVALEEAPAGTLYVVVTDQDGVIREISPVTVR